MPPLRRRCNDRALALHPGPLSVRRELDAEALEGFAFGEGDVGAMEVEDVGVERGVAVGVLRKNSDASPARRQRFTPAVLMAPD